MRDESYREEDLRFVRKGAQVRDVCASLDEGLGDHAEQHTAPARAVPHRDRQVVRRRHGGILGAALLEERGGGSPVGEPTVEDDRRARVRLLGADRTQAADRLGEEGDRHREGMGLSPLVAAEVSERDVDEEEGPRRVEAEGEDVRLFQLRLSGVWGGHKVGERHPVPRCRAAVGAKSVLVAVPRVGRVGERLRTEASGRGGVISMHAVG